VPARVKDAERVALDFDYDPDRAPDLDEVVQLVAAQFEPARGDLRTLLDVGGEDADLLHAQIGEEGNNVVVHLDDEARLAVVLPRDDLRWVSGGNSK